MANRVRINVKFGDTKLLVPCGDGSIAVNELINKAVGRFKKHRKLHEDDEIIVENLFQEGGSVVDRDDEVIDVLDDRETVILAYKHIPHDAPPDFEPVLIGDPSSSVLLNSISPAPSLQHDTPHISTVAGHAAAASTENLLATPAHPSPLSTGSVSPSYRTSSPSTSYTKRYPIMPDFNNESYTSQQNVYLNPSISNDYDSHLLIDGELTRGSKIGGGVNESDEFRQVPEEHRLHSSELLDDSESLSQVIDDHMSFSQEIQSVHPHSQVSIHSEEASQNHHSASQKYSDHTPSNYEMELLTPASHVDTYSETQRPNQLPGRSSSQHNLDTLHMESPMFTKDSGRFSFTHSQSMEHLHDYQQPKSTSQDQYPHFNRGSNSFQQPALSQDYSMVHSQQDLHHFFPDQQMSGYNIMMTQPEGTWNPRMYSVPGGQRYRTPQYDAAMMRGHQYPIQRGQYVQGRGKPDPFERTNSRGDADYYHNFQSPQYNEYMERRKRNSVTGVPEVYDDHYIGGRGMNPHPRYNQPGSRGWMKKVPDEDGYNYFSHRPMIREDDPNIEHHLSQPTSYVPSSRYPPYLGIPVVMGRHGGGMNAPSGYPLSQPSMSMRMPYDRHIKQRRSALKNRNEQSPRSDVRSTSEDPRDRTFSIDEELYEEDEDMDEMKPSPFQRAARKSMFLDSTWGRWQERLEAMELPDEYECQVPEYNGEGSQGQRVPSPTISVDEKEDREADDLENIHIVELLRGDEPLGIHLVSYTSQGRDLGVFIGALDQDGFAGKSGNLCVSDRILACNGEDFTQESNERVEERFRDMAVKEPLLRMAISRGFNLDLQQSQIERNNETDESHHQSVNTSNTNGLPSGETASPPSNTTTVSNVLTNTRQIGVKHTIGISRGTQGTFGFGLTSRDVSTNEEDHPIYVKSITSQGPAFHDGRLRIGDRILEVNDVSVKGMSQTEVVNLLKASSEKVTLVVSRQEQVETQDDEFLETSEVAPLPASVGKSVMILEIPLNNCGLAGLGVTVHGRVSNSRKHLGDMGIYIKSIVPGGAAAQDGRLRVNDLLLSVNGQSLTNMSNSNALEALKKALHNAKPEQVTSIQLTVARTAGIQRKHCLSMSSFSSQMPALKEEERPDPDGRTEGTVEVGIDCPADMKLSPVLSQEMDLSDHYNTQIHDNLRLSRSSTGSQGSTGGRFDPSLELYPSHQRYRLGSGDPHQRSLGDYTDTHMTRGESSPQINRRSRERSHDDSPPRVISNHKSHYDNTMDHMIYHKNHPSTSSPRNRRSHMDHMTSDTKRSSRNSNSPMRQESLSPTTERVSWYIANDLTHSLERSRNSHSPLSYPRSASVHSELSSHMTQPIYQHPHHHMSTNTLPFSPPDHSSYSSNSSKSFQRSRESSFRRTISPPYDTLEGSPTPSNRGRVNNEALSTLPRCNSVRSSSGKYTINEGDTTANGDEVSLFSYASDSELNNPFQRDDVARRSIPKKKNQPQPNLSHLRLANMEPRLEGEGSPSPPLYRTGSDGDITLNNSHYFQTDMLKGIEVGPHLRLAKSSSLESLQTVMHYTIHADGGLQGDGNIRRNRSTRNSFRRAVDHSYSQESQDGDSIPSSTVISLTKSPKKKYKPNRKSIFSWIKTKKSKTKKDKNRHSRVVSSEFDFSEESIEEIAKQFGISEETIRRMQSHSGKLKGDSDHEDIPNTDNNEDSSSYVSHNSRAL